jgi:hypothetical protein
MSLVVDGGGKRLRGFPDRLDRFQWRVKCYFQAMVMVAILKGISKLIVRLSSRDAV